jgi:hypothetical protein
MEELELIILIKGVSFEINFNEINDDNNQQKKTKAKKLAIKIIIISFI